MNILIPNKNSVKRNKMPLVSALWWLSHHITHVLWRHRRFTELSPDQLIFFLHLFCHIYKNQGIILSTGFTAIICFEAPFILYSITGDFFLLWPYHFVFILFIKFRGTISMLTAYPGRNLFHIPCTPLFGKPSQNNLIKMIIYDRAKWRTSFQSGQT